MKILIADDEPLVRFSLKSMIEELNLGLTLAGEATNGEELVSLVHKSRPDIALVDIRMPGLGGLAAIRKAQKGGSRTRWVILTSHAEFEYAAEAIQLGVASYLLKPAGPAQLAEVLGPLMRAIAEERKEASARFEKTVLAAWNAPMVGALDPPLVTTGWLAAFRLDVGATTLRKDAVEFSAATLEQVRTAATAWNGGLLTAVWPASAELLWAAASWDDAEGRTGAGALLERLTTVAKQTTGKDCRLTAVVADHLGSWPEVVAAQERLRQTLGLRSLWGTGTLHTLDALDRRPALPPAAVELATAAEAYLAARDRGDVPELETLAQKIQAGFTPLATTTYLEAVARHLTFRTGGRAPALGEDLQKWIGDWAAASRAQQPEVRRNADLQVRIAERVDQYLRQRLAEEVRVPDLASALGLSPNYLSSVYHKFTQTTISERLAALRLDHARELLSHPGSQVKEVAAAVGYKSPRHFARLYHERFGRYPSGR